MIKEFSINNATSMSGHSQGAQPLHYNKHIRSWSRSSAFTLQQVYQVMVKEFSLPHCNTTKISGLGQRA
jgi:hypothetical protein